jgi:hypothetical protein
MVMIGSSLPHHISKIGYNIGKKFFEIRRLKDDFSLDLDNYAV